MFALSFLLLLLCFESTLLLMLMSYLCCFSGFSFKIRSILRDSQRPRRWKLHYSSSDQSIFQFSLLGLLSSFNFETFLQTFFPQGKTNHRISHPNSLVRIDLLLMFIVFCLFLLMKFDDYASFFRQHIENTLNPSWPEFKVDSNALCSGNYDLQLRVRIFVRSCSWYSFVCQWFNMTWIWTLPQWPSWPNVYDIYTDLDR